MKESSESDIVFRLGWMMEDKENVHKAIKQLQKWVCDNLGFCGEADTRAMIEVMLRGLGWDTLEKDVAREGTPRIGDIHLYVKEKIVALIEAKRLHIPNAELQGDPFRQLAAYAETLSMSKDDWIQAHRLSSSGKVFVYGVLTNGQLWWIYNFTHPVKGAEDKCLSINVSDFDTDSVNKLLSVIGKKQVCAEVEKFLNG